MFLAFLLPYWAGRFSGSGSFGMEDVNLVFTAPILPRTLLLSGLIRRLGGILILAFTAMFIVAFVVMLGSVGATIFVPQLSQVLIVGFFGLVLAVVCKLLGMFLFVAYRQVYRWIGFIWFTLLAGVYLFHVSRAGWDWLYGVVALIDSHIFALTPLVGWAMAAAYGFIVGNVLYGLSFTGLLLGAGGYFFAIIYISKPDFYEETSDTGDKSQGAAAQEHKQPTDSVFPQGRLLNNLISNRGLGAQAFFYKHVVEWARESKARLLSNSLFLWIVFAIAWGIYVQNPDFNLEIVAMLYIIVGVPSETILAVLMPLVFASALTQYDRGFMEFSSHYFYLIPDKPANKLLWISASRVINMAAKLVFVLALAGVISRTAPSIILAAMLAYVSCGFMVLGVRGASVRLLGMIHSARQKLATALSVIFFVLLGWVGMMAIFFLGPENWGLLVAMLAFAGWCLAIGGLGFWFAAKTLHDVDATV